MAFGFVLVASIVRSPAFHLAFVITTLSAAAGAPGVRVIVVVRVTPNHAAVMVTAVVALTVDVVTGNAPLAWPPLTTVSAGAPPSPAALPRRLTTAPAGRPGDRPGRGRRAAAGAAGGATGPRGEGRARRRRRVYREIAGPRSVADPCGDRHVGGRRGGVGRDGERSGGRSGRDDHAR